MESIFIQLGIVILVVLGVSVIMKLLRQPLMIGYILSGIIVGPFFLNLLQPGRTINLFSEIGIAFLLFVVGLHLSPKVIKEIGPIALIAGIGQIIFTFAIGYFIGIWLGLSSTVSLYVAIALAFSSTIVVMKFLSDKDNLEKLYGKISIGFLLVQDLIHMLVLIILSYISRGATSEKVIFSNFFGGIFILGILVLISYYTLPKLSEFFAKSQELLFVFAISWGIGLSLLFSFFGFSIEVGALIAGIMLSMSPYSFEISSKLKTLRDFFIIAFFLILGSQIAFGEISHLIFPAIILSLFILIGNPLIVMILMGLKGYSKKTGFMTGITIAQISEFSLILIAFGVKIGSLSQDILSFVTIIALITIAGSTYMSVYADAIYKKLSRLLGLFEKKKVKEKNISKKHYDYILLGYNRIGFSIIKSFSKITKNFLVVDYNPQIVKGLKKEGINAIYGDVDDSEFLEDLGIQRASVVVSTIPEKETNQLILDLLKRNNSKSVSILTGRQIEDALELYNEGANYVIMPHFLGGEYAAKLIENARENTKYYQKEKEKEMKLLKERLAKGQKHPRVEKDKKF